VVASALVAANSCSAVIAIDLAIPPRIAGTPIALFAPSASVLVTLPILAGANSLARAATRSVTLRADATIISKQILHLLTTAVQSWDHGLVDCATCISKQNFAFTPYSSTIMGS
jgi:hypothetical protein